MHTSKAATEGLTSSLRGIKRSSYLPNRPTVSQDEDPRGERGARRLTFFGGVLEDMSISLVVERFRRCAISFTSGVSMVEAGMDPLPTLLRKVSGNNLGAGSSDSCDRYGKGGQAHSKIKVQHIPPEMTRNQKMALDK